MAYGRSLHALVSTLWCASVVCQTAPAIEWQVALGGTGYEYAHDLQQTSDGGYVVCGSTESNDGDVTGNHGASDAWVVKLDAVGAIEWQRAYGGTGGEEATSVAQTMDGGYVFAGNSNSNNGDVSGHHGDLDGWVVRTDALGDIIWQRSIGGSLADVISTVRCTSDGGCIVTGYTESNDGDVSGNHGLFDAWVVKLDPNGAIQWQMAYGGSGSESFNDVRETTPDGYVCAGWTSSNDGDVSGSHGSTEMWLVTINDIGGLRSQRTFGGTNGESAFSVVQVSDSSFVLGGWSSSNNGDVSGSHGQTDFWLLRTGGPTTGGWQTALGGPDRELAYAMGGTPDGGFVAGGYAFSDGGDVVGAHGTQPDGWVVRLDGAGQLQWQLALGGTGDDQVNGIHATSDGGYILVAYSTSTDDDVSGNHGSGDMWVVKLGYPLRIAEAAKPQFSILHSEWNAIRVIANPLLSNAEMVIRDSSGRVLYRDRMEGSDQQFWIPDFAAGVYFVELRTSAYVQVRRFLHG